MLRTLPLVAVRQEQNESSRKSPLVFAGAQELVDDDLRAVDEVAELRFPQDERLGIVAAESVFEAKTRGFGERRVVDLAKSLFAREVREGQIIVFGLAVDQNSMSLVEGAALGILAGQANRRAFEH